MLPKRSHFSLHQHPIHIAITTPLWWRYFLCNTHMCVCVSRLLNGQRPTTNDMNWFDCIHEFFNVISKSHGITWNFCPFISFSFWVKKKNQQRPIIVFHSDEMDDVDPRDLQKSSTLLAVFNDLNLKWKWYIVTKLFLLLEETCTEIRMIHRYIRFRSVLNFHYIINGLDLNRLHNMVNCFLIII